MAPGPQSEQPAYKSGTMQPTSWRCMRSMSELEGRCPFAFLLAFSASVWVVSDPAIPLSTYSGCQSFMWGNRRAGTTLHPSVDLDMDIMFPTSCNQTEIFTACYTNAFDGYSPLDGRMEGSPVLKAYRQQGLRWQAGAGAVAQ